LIKSISP